MINLIRTNSSNTDFISLVKALDAYLKITDGDEHAFYNQYNSISQLNNVVIAYQNNEAVACGAFKPFETNSVEIKRMYTNPKFRQQGIAKQILNALETWAKELNYQYCILETGKRQKEAVAFYKANGYQKIPNYGQYTKMDNSLCFKKEIS